MADAADHRLEWACVQVLARYYRLLDESRFRDAADLFAADGTWHRQGKVLVGPAGVFGALQARSKTLVTRHVMSGPVVTLAPGGASVASNVTVYSSDNGAPPALPATVHGPHAVLDSEVRLSFLQDRIAIQAVVHRPVFLFSEPAK